MKSRERVQNAILHKEADRVPKGEVYIQPELANRILGRTYSLNYQDFDRDVAIRKKLNMDLVNVGEWPEWQIGVSENGHKLVQSIYGQIYEITDKTKHIVQEAIDIEDAENYRKPDCQFVTGQLVERYVKETEFFVFAQIGGPVSMVDEMYTMEDYMVYCLTNTEEVLEISEKVIEYEIEKAKIFIDKGAHGILIADDIAFNTGVFLPPHIMGKIVFPLYRKMLKEIKSYKEIPVFLHTDGNINTVMEDITACGFDGIQSLQPSAGMDIADIKNKYGHKLCLWGNIDLDQIMCFGTPQEVAESVRETILAANKNGGFILSTCNTMIDSIPTENVWAMIKASENILK
ncbi:uroporphyrinogen decarboxylase family protein [Faecalicatena contorta]|uniref:uroporphyrinogen decarboxylase family protein n=1 Tax=Faecalicatena contorta TaxID=39482 RepID=UPI002EA902EA|nr:uroporphyrinogen decarboxylase family protein [Muricomes sp.]